MDDHVRFSGTKYAKGNNNKNGNHYKCGENCSKIRGRTPRPPPRVRGIGARSAKYTGISGAPMSVFVYMSVVDARYEREEPRGTCPQRGRCCELYNLYFRRHTCKESRRWRLLSSSQMQGRSSPCLGERARTNCLLVGWSG